jgi:predicted protein tyrosine phosphatase
MLWKYCLPESWNTHEERVAFEDIYLMRENMPSEGEQYWFTLEALQSKTGGTRRDKLAKLGDREFVIDDMLDMLIRRENFDRDELLAWTKEFIRSRLGDSEPVLVEADRDEFDASRPATLRASSAAPSMRSAHILFVFHHDRLHAPTPDTLLELPRQLEIRTAGVIEGAPQSLPVAELEWSEIIVVLERRIRALVHKRCKALGLERRVICLYLPEHIDVDDPTYAAAFRSRMQFYLQRMNLPT